MTQLKLSFLFTIFMSMVGVKAFAYGAGIDGIFYSFSGTEATVVNSNNKYLQYSGNIVIPESVYYNEKTYSVTSIGGSALVIAVA